MRIIYLFIDGIGFGAQDSERNPFTRYARSYLTPLGGKPKNPPDWYVRETDAHLGIPGLPQSATGQTSLWTGVNAQQALGAHKTGFPGPVLRSLIEKHGLIKEALDRGKKATLLNAYSEKYLKHILKHPRLISASTRLQLASGQPLKTMEELESGEALFMDITHEFLHAFHPEMKERLPYREPYARGRDFIAMSRRHDLTIFEYFLSDKAGHNQSFEEAALVIATLEEFLRGVHDELNPEEELFISASDHGNLEDLSVKTHTHNPTATLACGKNARRVLQEAKSLTDIPRLIREMLYENPEEKKSD